MNSATVKAGVAGAAGRMGKALVQACHDTDGFALAGALECPGHPDIGTDAGMLAGVGETGVVTTADLAAMLEGVDCLIDFTIPEATLDHLRACAHVGRRAVVGTTGLDEAQKEELKALSATIPIVYAPNMSIGVNVCLRLLETAARMLGDEVDIEIIEAHHRHKIDAPSGTALRMGEIIATALDRDLDACAVYGRQGQTGQRDRKTIGFATVRGGDIVGEHTVLFAGAGERLELTHRSAGRVNFAAGALRAARWLQQQPAGLYDMQDVLALD